MSRAIRWILALAFALALLCCGAQAQQDFYGEGNVLIAVDMGPFRVNEDAVYPEGTMGTLVWGDGAATGTSTRPAFAPRTYTPTLGVVPAGEYEIETTYEVGQTLLFPYSRGGENVDWLEAEAFPEEVASRIQDCLLRSKVVDGKTYYYADCDILPDDTPLPTLDFLEIECVAVTEHSTFWQYTGNVYSSREGFDPAEYGKAVSLSEEELRPVMETCDRAYQAEAAVYGDPHWEDAAGDRDGKAAFVFFDYSAFKAGSEGYYADLNTKLFGFDCLILNPNRISGWQADKTYARSKEVFLNTLCHELNHYILYAITEEWNLWLGESIAQRAVDDARPENTDYLEFRSTMVNECTRARLIPGMLWEDDSVSYPPFKQMPYSLGDLFLRYIEGRTTGEVSSALWTEFFAENTPEASITNKALDAFLLRTTGESLESWMAQFLASLIAGAEEGPYALEQSAAAEYSRPEMGMFLRDWQDYGKNLTGFELPGAADSTIAYRMTEENRISAVSGGGTTFAWRNDAGGPISITGADDNWYFFAVTIELPDPEEVIEIASAADLARIGNDPAFPLSGHYVLTGDIDLDGSPENPWPMIGQESAPFLGVFDGNGHTIDGLYVDSGINCSGLFRNVSGNAVIRDLTVRGSVSGGEYTGGIAGYFQGGTLSGCTVFASVAGTQFAGGIAGYNHVGTITDCSFSGTVSGGRLCGGITGINSWGQVRNCRSTDTDIEADENAGGIAGMNAGGTIENCYHTGGVSADRYVGGVAGWIRDDGVIRNCYHAAGTVSGGEFAGSICGGIRTGTLENCCSLFPGLPANGGVLETATLTSNYVLAEEPGKEGTLTEEEFTRPESFEGWDFENTWTLESGTRPTLRAVPDPIVIYEAIFLDNPQIADIFTQVRGEAPYPVVTKDYHITIVFRPEKDERSLYGREIEVKITGYKKAAVTGDDGEETHNEGLKVELYPKDGEMSAYLDAHPANYHITGSYESQAKYTGYINFSDMQPVEYTVTGRFGAYLSDGTFLFQPEP